MIILGIDPGYDRCGWSIGKKINGQYQLLDFSVIQTDKKAQIFDRFKQIGQRLQELISEFQPEHLAIENLYFSKNTSTAMRVAEIRGLIIGLALQNQLQIFEYDPVSIKLAVTGNGRADKTSVAKLVLAQLKLQPAKSESAKIVDDAMDALAVGLTHAVTWRDQS